MKGEKVQNVGIIVNQSIEIGDREVIVYHKIRCPMPMNWVKRGSVQMKPMPGTLPATANNYLGRNSVANLLVDTGILLDFTDAALIWLADSHKERRILTVDKTDFSVFRLWGGLPFELVDWN